jgi:hypothetical protein
LKEIFRNRVFKIDGNDKYYSMPRGVCQGSALGPLLFSLYINSVGSCFTSPFLLYADDLVLYDSGTDESVIINNLSLQIEKLCDWCERNGVNVNFDKTNFMVFHKERDRTSSSDISKITVRNKCIDRVFSFKYLGLWFDPHLNFNFHYNSVLKKVVGRIKFMRGIKRYLTPQVMKTMLNAYIHSVIDYGIDIWAVQPEAELQQIQRKIDRFLLEFYSPSHYKKRKKVNGIGSISNYTLLDKFNFLTLVERRNYVTLKVAFNDYENDKLEFSDRNCRTFPLLKVVSHSSESYKKSIAFRTYKLWNSLPREWELNSLSYSKFKALIVSVLKCQRKNDYIYY